MGISVDALAGVEIAMDIAGKNIVFNRDNNVQTSSDYDESKGEFDPEDELEAFTPVTVRGVTDNYKLSEINNDTVLRGDQKAYIQTGSYTPRTGDIATVDSKDFRVQDVFPIYADEGIVVLYGLQLRR